MQHHGKRGEKLLDNAAAFCYVNTQDNMINATKRKSTRIFQFQRAVGWCETVAEIGGTDL